MANYDDDEVELTTCEACGIDHEVIIHDFGCVALCEDCSMDGGVPHCPRTSRSGQAEECEWCVAKWEELDESEESEESEEDESEEEKVFTFTYLAGEAWDAYVCDENGQIWRWKDGEVSLMA